MRMSAGSVRPTMASPMEGRGETRAVPLNQTTRQWRSPRGRRWLTIDAVDASPNLVLSSSVATRYIYQFQERVAHRDAHVDDEHGSTTRPGLGRKIPDRPRPRNGRHGRRRRGDAFAAPKP